MSSGLISRLARITCALTVLVLASVHLAFAAGGDQPSAVLVAKTRDAVQLIAEAATNSLVRVTVVLRADLPGQAKGGTATLQALKEVASSAQQAFQADHVLNAPAKAERWKMYLFKHVPSVILNANASDLEELAADPRVLRIDPPFRIQPALDVSTVMIGMPAAYANNATGSGRYIAILDSGVQADHPFLSPRVKLEACQSGHGNTADSLCPNGQLSQISIGAAAPCTHTTHCNHGTHVAGIAAGFQPTGTPPNGVAKAANIFAIQVFSYTSDHTDIEVWNDDLNQALDLVLSTAENQPIDAVNLSLGIKNTPFQATCDDFDTTTTNLINALKSANVATVVAAGNDKFTNAASWPSCIASAISVGASDKNDKIGWYSNLSSKVELLAPGGDGIASGADATFCRSLDLGQIISSVPGNRFCRESGTSQAAPHVAGAFAAIRSRLPSATIDEIRGALASTGSPIIDVTPRDDGKTPGSGLVKPRIRVDLALNSLLGGAGGQKAAMTTPAPGSTLSGASVTFAWTAGSGVSQYWVYVGNAAGGSDLYSQSQGTNLQTTVSGLPTDGRTLYVRLWSLIGGAWQFNDYTYKAAGTTTGQKAAMTTPAPGSTLTVTTTFAWTSGIGVSQYWLYVGSTSGGSDMYTASQGTNLSVTLCCFPTDGRTIYVRLWSLITGAWQFNDYTYKDPTGTGATGQNIDLAEVK